MPNVRETVWEFLRANGMTTIFGNPGSTELPLFRDFPDDFRYVLGLQESVVVGMADGFAQATGNAAFVNLHSTAGTGHALGNIFTAWKNQAPLVITAGQQSRSILSFEPFLHAERPTEFPQPFVKWACEPATAAMVPHAIARAYREAMTPPYGPTFVSVPADDWDAECEPLEARRFASMNPGDPVAIEALAADLRQAKRPALVLGAGIARDGAWDEVVSLAERQRAAVYVAPYASRNVFPEDHRLFQGFLPAFRETLVAMLHGHDLIVAMGGPLNLYHAEGNGPHLPPGARCWLVADQPGALASAPQGNAILGNGKAVAGQLLAQAGEIAREWPDRRRDPPQTHAAFLDDRLLMERIAHAMPDGAIVVEEAPTARGPMHDHLPLTAPGTFFTTASGGLGYGMPAAVGVALANPDRHVVALIGDGSAMYGIQAMFAAFQLGAAVTFVIINNQSYSALEGFASTFGMNRVVGTDLAGLDFRALAKGHGLPPGVRVTNAKDLDTALAEAFAGGGPGLIEVAIERNREAV